MIKDVYIGIACICFKIRILWPYITSTVKSPDRSADITFRKVDVSFKVIRPLGFHVSYKNDAQYFEKAARFLGKFSVRHTASKRMHQ